MPARPASIAVTVVVPLASAVTSPSATFAIDASEDDHIALCVMSRVVPSLSIAVAVSCVGRSRFTFVINVLGVIAIDSSVRILASGIAGPVVDPHAAANTTAMPSNQGSLPMLRFYGIRWVDLKSCC